MPSEFPEKYLKANQIIPFYREFKDYLISDFSVKTASFSDFKRSSYVHSSQIPVKHLLKTCQKHSGTLRDASLCGHYNATDLGKDFTHESYSSILSLSNQILVNVNELKRV